MIRLAAIDLDGTLFDSQQNITALSKQAIQNALNNGIRIVIVTGRGRTGAEHALDMLGLELPYICSAGALARAGRDGEALYAHAFHYPKEVNHLLEFTRLNGTGLIADTPEGVSMWFGPDTLEEVMDPMSVADARKSLRTYTPETDFDRPLLKLTIAAELELLQQAEKVVHAKCPSIHQTYSGLYIDLTDKDVNKGTALKALAELWRYHPLEIAAIGDQAIDIEMLKYAGLPVAMSNGVAALKLTAQWIAPSNDEDGVAWALERMVRENTDHRKDIIHDFRPSA